MQGDPALAQKLLTTLLCQQQTHRPGRKRTTLPERPPSLQPHRPGTVAARVLEGDDTPISLTDHQVHQVVVRPRDQVVW